MTEISKSAKLEDVSPNLKLTYFSDNKGRNELIRLIFAIGNVPYEDELVGFVEYTNLRDSNSLPWGQLPTLTIPNSDSQGVTSATNKYEVFGQSCSMARYAAKKAGIYPINSDIEALRTDGIVDSWRDMLDLYYETVFDRKIIAGRLQMVPHPPSARHAKLAAFVSSELSMQFERYEAMLQPTGKFCRDETVPFPCWADLAVYDLLKTMEGALTKAQFSNLMDGKKFLPSLVEKIDAIDTIQDHLKKYPYTDTSHYFVKVSPVMRPIEIVLLPVFELFLGLWSHLRFWTNSSPKIEAKKN